MRKTRKLQVLGAIFAISLLAITACGSADDDSAGSACEVGQIDGDLAAYNWAEYIDEEQLAAFAEEYGISFTLDTYESNEAMQPIISREILVTMSSSLLTIWFQSS